MRNRVVQEAKGMEEVDIDHLVQLAKDATAKLGRSRKAEATKYTNLYGGCGVDVSAR